MPKARERDMRMQKDGDIGGYFQYGLLRSLAYSSFRLGMQAYCSASSPLPESSQGTYTQYLGNPVKYKACDPELFETLKALTRQHETKKNFVDRIAQSHLFPADTVFYTDPLSFQEISLAYREQHRQGWFAYGVRQLRDCNLVFLNPAVGLETKHINPYASINGPRYVAMAELQALINQKQTIMIHQRVARSSVKNTIEDCKRKVGNATGYAGSIETLSFTEGGSNLTFILPAAGQEKRVTDFLKAYKASHWGVFIK